MILSQLIKRIFSRGKSLNKFEIEDIKDRYFVPLIKEIQCLSNRINMESGKPKSKKNRKKHYKKLLNAVEKALKLFEKEIAAIELRVGKTSLKPSKYSKLLRLVEMMKLDMENIRKVKEYCRSRIFENKSTPSKEKILSISDKDAGYIEKGNREAKIGYKPQIGRSKQGFIPAILIPKGNAADSAKLPELIEEALNRTKILPDVISTDDGYVNSDVRNEYLKKGVKTFSFSGSKGKKLISEEDWSSEEYKIARNNRSSVESLMYTIKDGFDFGHVMRRGLENVRAELLEKVIAYNFCRIIEVRNKEQDEQRLKAA
jgi:IS5 family transposase